MLAAVVLLVPGLLSPQTAEAVTRAAALELTKNPRFDVISELDLKDVVELSAQRQACGADAESCAAQLAGAYDAQLVVFLSIYAVGPETHVQLTLRDLKADRVVQRADATGRDEPALFAAVQADAREALTHFSDYPAEGRVRLLVSRAAIPPATVAAEAPAKAPTPPGPPMVLIGGAVAGGGTLLAIGGTITGLLANGVVGDQRSLGTDKDGAEIFRTVGYVGAGIGGGVAIAGVVVATLALGGP